MYANIYQIRSNKYNLGKNNYISTIKQKNKYNEEKQLGGTYLNKRTNLTKYINPNKGGYNEINHDISKNNTFKAKQNINKKINSSK